MAKMREVWTERIYKGQDGKYYKTDVLTRSHTLRNDKDVNNWSLLKVVGFILLFSALFALVSGARVKTFAGFLEMLQNVPSIDTQGLMSLTTFDLPDWGSFEFLAVFIEGIGGLLSFVIWFLAVMVNACSLALYFIGWLVGV